VIATDADVDGMHISLLITFFSTIFSWVDKDGHLYILQTPLSEYETRKKLFIVILMKNEK
jgi:DNA gyrase/topoisomerase IV subunit B